MNKILIAIVLCIVLTGCQQLGTKKPIKTDADYKTGFNGLTLKFIEKPILREIYENNPMSLKVLLENKGASTIERGIIILGFEEQNFQFITSEFTEFNLEGKSIYYPKGNKKLNTFQLESKEIPGEESIERETSLYLAACYSYKTDFSQDICMDSDIYGLKNDKACSPKKISLSNGQGAPVTVTSIGTRMIFKSEENEIIPQFTIKIENKGDGTIISRYNLENVCSAQSIGKEELKKIDFKAELFGDYGNVDLECSPDNPIDMKGKKVEIVCTSPKGLSTKSGTYLSPLHTTIEYGYMKIISKDIKIKKVLT